MKLKIVKRKRIIAIAAALTFTACLTLAQEQPQDQAGGDQAGGQAQGAAGRGGGRSPDRFPQFIRPLASQDLLVRGKSLYDANCAGCHAVDMRGVLSRGGPNLLRSAVTMDDQRGELIGATMSKHTPPLNLVGDDIVAVSEYIHSILATMGSQGSPPGRIPTGLQLNVLVGDAQAGKAYFDAHCASCHSATGDLKAIGGRYEDPRSLQNAWVAGTSSSNPFAGRASEVGRAATVTMPNGNKIEGKLARRDDFAVILTLADGTRRTIAIEDGVKVVVADPQAAHKQMVLELDDAENKNMHDVTAYLATLK